MTIVGIYFWLGTVNLSPDSATYMSVANNLKNYGLLFKWVNWPSAIMSPQVEPFTDFAPGLMLLSYPFVLIFGNPLTAIMALQTLLIGFYGYVLYLLVKELFKESIIGYFFAATMFLFPLFMRIETYFWTELPFISLTFLAIYHIVKFNSTNNKSHLFYAAMIIMVASIFKYIGVFNISLFVILYFARKINIKDLLKYTLVSIIGIVIWFGRNYLIYGAISRSHSKSDNYDLSSITMLYDKLANVNSFLPVVAIVFVLLFIVLALTPYLFNKKIISQNYKLVLGIGSSHLVGILLLSMFTKFDSLGARLLSPSLAIFTVLFTVILYNLNYNKFSTIRKASLGVYIAILFAFNLYTLKPNIFSDKTLKEEKLWEYLHSDKRFEKTTHFYSEFDLNHEFYCRMPMRVIYNEDSIDVEYINDLLKIGKHPIFVYKENSLGAKKMDLLLDNCNLNVIDTLEFKIYYLEGR